MKSANANFYAYYSDFPYFSYFYNHFANVFFIVSVKFLTKYNKKSNPA